MSISSRLASRTSKQTPPAPPVKPTPKPVPVRTTIKVQPTVPGTLSPSPDPAHFPTRRGELSPIPTKRCDVPNGEPIVLGRLSCRVRGGYPKMFVNITCEKCQKTRYIPWRWDWGLDPDVVSLQRVYRCHGKPRWAIARWIALDPAFQAENEAVRRESDQYFVAFQEAKAKAKEAKKAKATESGEAS